MKRLTGGAGAGALALFLFLLVCAVAWAAETLVVIEKDAAIRRLKRSYGFKVGTVTEGDEVTLLEKSPPWLRVEYKGLTGWMHESSVTEDKRVVLSTTATARGARATEQSTAARGFNPQVEERYRSQNIELEQAFSFLDSLEKTTYPEEQVVAFLEDGGLAGFDAGGGAK